MLPFLLQLMWTLSFVLLLGWILSFLLLLVWTLTLYTADSVYAAYVLRLWLVLPFYIDVGVDAALLCCCWRGYCHLYCCLTGARPFILLFVGTQNYYYL